MTMFASQWLANPDTGYEIDQSIRFNEDDSAKLTGGTGQTGDGTQWTISMWIKRGAIDGGNKTIWSAGDGSNKRALSRFVSGGSGQASEDISFSVRTGGSWYELNVHQSFVDPSAWYHFVWVWDSDNGTAADRMRIYVNGERLTSFSNTPSYPASGTATDSWNNSSYAHQIGFENNTRFFDGYLAEIYHIDGQALTPASFGETNSGTGQWVPIDASDLTFGTRGFYLKGEDSSDLGNDSSGNGNDFTSSGLAAADQVSDSPTDNFCVMSPIDKSSAITLTDGNLIATNSGTNSWNHGRGTMFASSGKWYYEWTPTAGSYAEAGWMTDVGGNDHVEEESDPDTTYYRGVGAAGRGVVIGDGSPDTGPANFSNGDVVMMAIDVDTMKFWVGVNGTWYNSGDPAAGSNATGTWSARLGYAIAPWYGCFLNTSETFNFGQSSFSHTIPTGFNPWSTAGLGDPTIADPSAYFQTTIYTGDGSSSHEINQAGNSTFEPTMVWLRSRSAATDHVIQDQVRGNFVIYPNQNNADGATGGGWVSSFDSDGFTVSSNAPINDSGKTFVGWQWKAGSSSVSNTDGDITSTVRADSTSGVSVLTYSGNGSDNQTIGHGIGIAPKMIITKRRDRTGNWPTYHDAIGINQVFYLNSTAAPTSNTEQYRATPTSSVYTVGVGGDINNSSGTYVAYVFAEVEGFSKIGSYTGNGSTDGPFVPTGFKPRFILFMRSDAAEGRNLLDTARGSGNFGSAAGTGGENPTAGNDLNAKINVNDANAEEDNPTGSRRVSYVSNGFKVRNTNTAMNANGSTYIYMAFAESPFKTSTAR